jgi:hypothetical protein
VVERRGSGLRPDAVAQAERVGGVECPRSGRTAGRPLGWAESVKGVKTQISFRLRLAGRPLFGEEAD